MTLRMLTRSKIGRVFGSADGGDGVRVGLWVPMLVVALGVAARILFLTDWRSNFDADEALVALQAMQIGNGYWPPYLTGQGYMGSLQSLIGAPLLHIFGHHINVVRLGPLLWLLPGYLALLRLRRVGMTDDPAPATKTLLLSQWLLPPAVLFLTSVKVRGGNLESLVLLLWSTALLWEACRPRCSRTYARFLLAGGLLGVAVWTHDQALLGVPLLLALLAAGAARGRWWGVPLFSGATLLGFVPLWWPRLAPQLIGPTGVEGTGLTIDWAWVPKALPKIPDMLRQCLVAGANPGIWIQILNGTLVLLSAGAFLWLLGSTLRRFPRQIAARPLEVTVLCLALGNVVVLLLGPIHLSDKQWFRYTLYLAPAILVARARVLSHLPRVLGFCLHGLVVALTLVSYGYAKPAWEIDHKERDVELVDYLQEKKIPVVLTSWHLAYPLRFLSHDQLVASSGTPPRYPVADVIARFHPQCHSIRRLAFDGSENAVKAADLEELYEISLLQRMPPPPEIIEQLTGLDPIKTLVPHAEPYPLLPPRSWPRDWHGWPPQRPLKMFEAIVWCPSLADRSGINWETVARRIEQLIDSGAFVEVARVRSSVILKRAPVGASARLESESTSSRSPDENPSAPD